MVCEQVLQEKDGVMSAIRIIDRVFFGADSEGTPLDPHYRIKLLVSWRAGETRGRYTARVVMEKPSGEQVPVLQAPVHLEGEERGVNLVIDADFAVDQEGLYWFDVYFEDERVTRIPLRAVYQPQPIPGRG